MSSSLVSVVIPVYNAALTLKRCLDSVVCQTHSAIEILCVDDGSSDDSVTLLENYANRDERIKIFRSGNRGGGAARNIGIEAASGEYCLFLDSDDHFIETMVEELLSRIEETASDIAICMSYDEHVDSGVVRLSDWTFVEKNVPTREPFAPDEMQCTIFNTFSNVPWNKMYRRSFLLENGLRFQEIMRTNDLFFTCHALIKAQAICTVRKPLVYYCQGYTSNCQATNHVDPPGFLRAFAALSDAMHDEGVFSYYEVSFMNHLIDACAYNLLSQDELVGFSNLYSAMGGVDASYGISSFISKSLETDGLACDRWQYRDFRRMKSQSEVSFLFEQQRIYLGQKIRAERENRRLMIQIGELESRCEECEGQYENVSTELERLKTSRAFRLGTALATPFRLVKRLFH